jgi:hypothetical protein
MTAIQTHPFGMLTAVASLQKETKKKIDVHVSLVCKVLQNKTLERQKFMTYLFFFF